MDIVSGNTDKYIFFVAVDETDFTTRETGLSSFTVRRARNGNSSFAYTTPTIDEVDSTSMPGVYRLLVDEDTTLDPGDDSQEQVLHITHAGMAPVTRTIRLYRPKIAEGATLLVSDITDQVWTESIADHSGDAGSFAEGIATLLTNLAAVLTDTGTDIPAAISALNDISAADVNAQVDTALSDYDGPTKAEMDAAFASTDGAIATIDANVDAVLVDTGTTIPASLGIIDGKLDTIDAVVDGVATSVSGLPSELQIADAVLTRDFADIELDSVFGTRSLLNAARFLRNRWYITGTTLSVTEEDDATVAWTATLSSDAGANPVVGSDPS